MKIFSWVQNKLSGKKSNSNIPPPTHHIQQPSEEEELGDWPHGLLAIGTFGNNKIKQLQQESADNVKAKANSQGQDHHHHHQLQGLTAEEVGRLEKELNLIFDENVGIIGPTTSFLDTNSSNSDVVDQERINCGSCSDEDSNDKNVHNASSLLVHQSRGKDMCLDNSKGAIIGKKSLSFLLKKMFVCRSGFSPAPSLRDPTLESRMEKMLRTLLHKKIYPQSSCSPKLSTKKSLGSSHSFKIRYGDKGVEKADDDQGSKWVKTDSEYIVLEI